jgi:hypothetical protein
LDKVHSGCFVYIQQSYAAGVQAGANKLLKLRS